MFIISAAKQAEQALVGAVDAVWGISKQILNGHPPSIVSRLT